MAAPETAFQSETQGFAGTDDRPDWLPLAAGAAIVFVALAKKRTLLSLAGLAGGGYLMYRAAQNGSLRLPDNFRLPENFDALRLPGDLVDRFRSQLQSQGTSRREGRDWYPSDNTDLVDEGSMDSFPASDPPAY